jgi:hypothetical protein
MMESVVTQLRQVQWKTWFQDNLLLLVAGFLLAFIPLFPKIPIWSPIEQYIVRVRLEDFLVFGAGILWLIYAIKGKIRWRSTFLWLILAYAVVGLLSVLSAVFITKTVPLEPLHIGKTLLHYFRYLEYFSLFAIVFSAVKNKKDLYVLLAVFAVTVIAIALYGYGQKYHYFPVYSTMNREFSKGVRLYLTPHARVQSTFAGHYDMAAYLVIALPLLLALAYQMKHKAWKTVLYVSFWLGAWLMILSASRTSFIAVLAGLLLVVGLTALQHQGWLQKIKAFVSKGAVLGLGLAILFAIFGADMNERLAQVLDSNQVWHDNFHYWNGKRKDAISYLQGNRPGPTPPPNSISTDEAIELGVLTPTDERPVPTRPSDVYVDVPDRVQVASTSADGTTTYTIVDAPRTYSDCALKHGLSLCIRLDTLWPRAIQGFMRNPLLGSGYATLNKETVSQFTEAESTDNNFLRTLGETGVLGFVTFYGTVAVGMWLAFKQLRSSDRVNQGLAIGFISASVGLLLNAVYIDVFAASKVAFTYWGLLGMIMGYFTWQASTSPNHSMNDLAAALMGPTKAQQKTNTKSKTKTKRK